MTYNFNNPIEVRTIASTDYPQPSLNKDGSWVVNASALNSEPNKLILYDPVSLQYKPIVPHLVSSDYYTQVKTYESRLSEQARGWANTDDPTQVNSVADLLFVGNSDFHPLKSTFSAIGQLLQGDTEAAKSTWWEGSDINLIWDKISATVEYYKEFVVEPMFSDLPFMAGFGTPSKASQALNNFMVNLSETVDIVTGANVVKGVMQDGLEGIGKGYNQSGEGRVQYNWNTKATGNTAVDTIANVALELATDPTNWVSFGATAAMKQVGKAGITGVLTKAATEVGIPLAAHQVDDIAKIATRNYIYKDTAATRLTDAFKQSLSRSQLNKYLIDVIPADKAQAFAEAVQSNYAVMKGTNTMNLLKSVRTSLDASQAMALRTVGLSSTLGLGYTGIREVVKLGKWAMPYMNSVYNKIFKESGIENMTLITMPQHARAVELELDTLMDVVKLSKENSKEIVSNLTYKFQELQYEKAKSILTQDATSVQIFTEFNTWARTQGATDGADLFNQLRKVRSVVADDLRRIVSELNNTYADVHYDTIVKTVEPLTKEIAKAKTLKELYVLLPALKNMAKLGVTTMRVPQDMFTKAITYLEATNTLEVYNANRVVVQGILDHRFKVLQLNTVFGIGRMTTEARDLLDTTAKSLRDVASRRQSGSLEVATMDRSRAAIITAGMSQLKNIIEGTSLQQRLLPEIEEIINTLKIWNNSIEDLPVNTARSANAALKALQRKITMLAGTKMEAAMDELINTANLIGDDVIAKLNAALMDYVDAQKKSFTHGEVTNIYTDKLIDKAALRGTTRRVKEVVTQLAKDHGAPEEAAKEMFIQVSDFENTRVLSSDDEQVKDTFEYLLQLASLLEDMRIEHYFIKELGLYELASEWLHTGFTIDLGTRLLNVLDDAIQVLPKLTTEYTFKEVPDKGYTVVTLPSGEVVHRPHRAIKTKPYTPPESLGVSKYSTPDDGGAKLPVTIQLFRDEVQSLVEMLGATTEGLAAATDAQLSSMVYASTLTHIQATAQLLSLSSVQDLLSAIRYGTGIGALTELLADPTLTTPNSQAVATLQGLSKSVYVANKTFELIDKSGIDPMIKQGLYDAIASEVRYGTYEIYDPKYMASKLLNSAKVYIDNFRNAHPARLFDLTNTNDPLEAATTLYNIVQRQIKVTPYTPAHMERQQYTDVTTGEVGYKNTLIRNRYEEEANHWGLVGAELAKDAFTSYNIVYSATTTGYQNGTLMEYAQVLPDGERIMLINKSARQAYIATLDEYTARKTAGKSKDQVLFDLRMRTEAYKGYAFVQEYETEQEFAVAMYELFKQNKSNAIRNSLVPRLVGFNNAMDSLGTDKVLAKYMSDNRLNTHIAYNSVEYKSLLTIRSFDAAQWIRAKADGAIVITDSLQKQVTSIMSKVKTYLEQSNARNTYAVAHLMPDFNTNVTASLRELKAAIENILDVQGAKDTSMQDAAEARLEVEDDYNSNESYDRHTTKVTPRDSVMAKASLTALSDEQYLAITSSFSTEELIAMQQQLSTALDDVGTMLNSIKNTNSVYGQFLLIQTAVAKHTGEANVSQILNKYLSNKDGISPYTYRKKFDPALFNEWFDKGYVQTFGGLTDIVSFSKLNEIAERLQSDKARVKHYPLLMEIPDNTYIALLSRLEAAFKNVPNYRFSPWAKHVLMLRKDGSKVNKFLVARLLWNSIKKVSHTDLLDKLSAQLQVGAVGRAFSYITSADVTVFSQEALNIPALDVLHSELITADNYIMQLTKEIKAVTEDVARAETIQDAMHLAEAVREETGIGFPGMRMKEKIVTIFGRLIDDAKRIFYTAQEWYYTQQLDTEEEIFQARTEYTKRVEKGMAQLKEMSTTLSKRRLEYIMTMVPKDFVTFLYKYAQGLQVYELGAEVFKDNAEMLTTFMQTLKGAEEYGVRYIENVHRHELYVSLDYTVLTNNNAKLLDEVEARAVDFKLNPPAIVLESPPTQLADSFVKYLDAMDEQFDGAYSISMHRTMDNSRYNELLAYLPKEVTERLIPKEYLFEHDMINGMFNQTIMGDYASGVGSIFTVYSGNLITNMAAGFSTAFNRLHSVDLYASALFNPSNTVKKWVQDVKRATPVTYKEFSQALFNTKYKVAELQNGRVVQVDVSTEAKYHDMLYTNAVLLDYRSYTHAVEVINDNNIDSKLYHAITRNYLGVLKLGQIMSLGTFVRNLFDSTTKFAIQGGVDAHMVAELVHTKRIMADYYATYNNIFTAYAGKMSPESIKNYYAGYKGEAPLMNRQLFLGLLNLYNSSSATPMAMQLKLMSNTVPNLYMLVKGDPNIKESDVKEAVAIFMETASEKHAFKAAFDKLKEVYPKEIAEKLILLRARVPKETIKIGAISKAFNKFPVTKFLLDANNKFEVFIRTVTFLREFWHTAGTIGSGLAATDFSQFNTTGNTKGQQILEMLFPFSSFQIDNALFWTDTMKKGRNNIIALTEDVLNGAYDEEQIDTEELSRNMSLQYLFMSGNLILDDESGELLKINDSLHGTMQMMANPIGYVANAWNVPISVLTALVTAMGASEEEYDKSSFDHTKPISRWTPEDYTDELTQLIPLFGVLYQRYKSTWAKRNISDAILPLIEPSVFGIAKLDSNIPVGYDWYNQSDEYKKSHRFVFGVSYEPSWMRKDPTTYANTFQRLQAMGYSAETATDMMQHGWYMKAPDYELKHYTPYVRKTYIKKGYSHYKKAYPKRTYIKRGKVRKIYFKKNAYRANSVDGTRMYRGQARRVYSTNLYSSIFTKTGVAREDMIKWRGANRSSRQLLIDRRTSQKIRAGRITRQIRIR